VTEEMPMTWYETLLAPVLSMPTADGRFIRAVENVKKAVDGLVRALATAPPIPHAPPLQTRRDGLGRMQAFTHTLARCIPAMGLESSREQPPDNTEACDDLPGLLRTRAHVRVLRGACRTLAPLIRVQFLKPPVEDAAPLGRAQPANTMALDALATIDAEIQLAEVVKQLDEVLATLERAIRLATRQQDSRIRWTGTVS
jgi:hypothetical protein